MAGPTARDVNERRPDEIRIYGDCVGLRLAGAAQHRRLSLQVKLKMDFC